MSKKFMLVLFAGVFALVGCHSSGKKAQPAPAVPAAAPVVQKAAPAAHKAAPAAAKQTPEKHVKLTAFQMYEKMIEASSRPCKVDSDCAPVAAGCCKCDGLASVNKMFINQLNQVRSHVCPSTAVCPAQNCRVEITSYCKNNECEGVVIKPRA
ncbi:MAG: hypothetical protein LBR90_04530 [Elusimicrobiota bacterium]|jgi:hypothetical protein|nr:hypothetical protein [Elusimicrobiota bacterium]